MKNHINTTKLKATLFAKAICFFALALLVDGAFALDCKHPQGVIEKKICSYSWAETEYEIEDLDANLNLTYQAALDRVPNREKLRIEQRAWLKVRDRCEEAKCFNDTYDARIRELAAIPGKSAANSIGFFDPELGADIDPKLIKSMQWMLLSRSGGLKYFDGGVNDFDIVSKFYIAEQVNAIATSCHFVLFGTGKTFSSSECENPIAASGNRLKFTPLPGDRLEGRDGRWPSKFFSSKGTELGIYPRGIGCEPFNDVLTASSPKTDEVLWNWMYFYETQEESKCWMSKKSPSVLFKFRAPNSFIGSPLLMPGGDVLVGKIRIDPVNGLPRDRSRVAAISREQATQIERRLLSDYLAENPTCKAKPETCPDPSIRVQYMWQHLAKAMKPFYVPAK
jgi:uncharacterized protein